MRGWETAALLMVAVQIVAGPRRVEGYSYGGLDLTCSSSSMRSKF